jgi:hypothetical protein
MAHPGLAVNFLICVTKQWEVREIQLVLWCTVLRALNAAQQFSVSPLSSFFKEEMIYLNALKEIL